ncbi:glycosyltransferase [Neorhizobium sp. AL 9.2.2]|uniref:glycosyltransferase n=1 Tax=Neorhizobium sp. AL 9.2.2 TaxID=2712894 RepID=UPI00157496F5|nr:glycosyltransferase [Neorhizobium sp. AL 9.2.2]NSY19759.1 hypothetical protein [Neorhizobium sp. AL 9.2.2]
MTRPTIVFLFNLVQDVSVLRPIAMMARRDFDCEIVFMVSHLFFGRDKRMTWQRELAQLRVDLGASIHLYQTPSEAFAVLQNRRGIILAGSESNLSAHAETHHVFRAAPPSFLTVTLQHGFECVGFLQTREHDLAHGRNVTFAANVVCGWCEAPTLTALALSERPKLYVTGPSTVLNTVATTTRPSPLDMGIVCENLHSVRMHANFNFGLSYMETFRSFAELYGAYGRSVTLRSHPAGQYVVNNVHDLPSNVVINNVPIYEAGLQRYRFGISAPSSILIDMLLAGIPTAVWHDAGGLIDDSQYAGLTDVSTLEDWLAFARDAVLRPDAILAQQAQFLDGLSMPTEPAEIYTRFARLLATGSDGPALCVLAETQAGRGWRICVLADDRQTYARSALAREAEATGDCTVLCEGDMVPGARPQRPSLGLFQRLDHAIRSARPDVLVLAGYTGPHLAALGDTATALEIPVILSIDSDPFTAIDGDPSSVERLLSRADLIYCTREEVQQSLRRRGFAGVMSSGSLSSSALSSEAADPSSARARPPKPGATKLGEAIARARSLIADTATEKAWMPQGSFSRFVETAPYAAGPTGDIAHGR